MFKKGDWIIATRPFRLENGDIDRSFLGNAVEVVDATPFHIVYVSEFSPDNTWILEPDRIEEQKFILAEPSIIEASKKKRNWKQVQQPPNVPKQKVHKTVECWVNFYDDGKVVAHPSSELADRWACEDRINNKAFHFVGQYTVEE